MANNTKLNYYQILGIEPTNDIKEVKKAYRRLCKEYHPDIGGNKNIDKFIEIHHVYEKIKTQELLDKYFLYYNTQQFEDTNNKYYNDEFYYTMESIYAEEMKKVIKEQKEKAKKKEIRKKTLKIASTILGGAAVVTIVFNIATRNNNQEEIIEVEETEKNQEEAPKGVEVEETQTYQLIRDYKIKPNDTLSHLAEDAGIPTSLLKQYNNLENDKIMVGKSLKIPYLVNGQDLKYYLKYGEVNTYDIDKLAKQYETTSDVLLFLNHEAITMLNDSYVILSSQIIVPNFITKGELKAIKNQENVQILQNSL